MRIAPKQMLVTLVFAGVALAAPSAFAQTEPLAHNQTPQIIVQNEVHGGTDVNCPMVTPSPPPNPAPTVTAGGCRSHTSGAFIELIAHISGGGAELVVSSCAVEYDSRTDAAGEGYATHHEFTQVVGAENDCVKRPCQGVGGESKAWSVYSREVEPAPTVRVTAVFCTENLDGSNPTHCEITAPVSSPAPHIGRITLIDVSSHGTMFPHCELGSATQPAILENEATLGTTGEAQAEQRVEVRHQ